MTKRRLFTPGPTPVPDRVLAAMARPIIHHRNREFEEIFSDVNEGLRYLFQTQSPVVTLSASGTGGMEAVLTNAHSAGDTVLSVENGKFSERWTGMARAHGLAVETLSLEWGRSPDPNAVKTHLQRNPRIKSVILTHSETSTGAATDIRSIAHVVRDHSDALILVDGVTSVAAMELRFDEWGLDAVVTGSQKGLMLPPGLALCALSNRMVTAMESTDARRYYFDLPRAVGELKNGTTPFTPAVSLIVGMQQALAMIREEGLENVWKRHAQLAEGCRRAMHVLGMPLLADNPANSVTAVRVPSGLDSEKIFEIMRTEHGITLAGGQDRLKGKVLRISHLGYYDRFDMLAVISGLEITLHKLGIPSSGSALQTFQDSFTSSA